MKRKYLIGEVCKLFNTTRDTLVHYEKIGLIKPKKDTNGYRYYGNEDINYLTDIFFLKKLDLSLNDINKAIKNSTPKDILDIITEKEKYIKAEINKLKELEQILQSMKINVQSCIMDLNKIDIRQEEESYLFIEITNENKFNNFIDIIEGMISVVEGTDIHDKNFLEYVNFSFLMDSKDLLNKKLESSIKWGVTLKQSYKNAEEIMSYEDIKIIPKNKYMYTVMILDDERQDLWAEKIYDIVSIYNISVSGPILGRMLLTEYNKDRAIDYYEIYIPIM